MMLSLWEHVRRGLSYTWADEETGFKRHPTQLSRTRDWELMAIRYSLLIVAVPSYLFWLRYLLLGPQHFMAAISITLAMVMLPLWLWQSHESSLGTVLWAITLVMLLDVATNFDSAVCASIHVVPALSAVLGGGRLVFLGTSAALVALLLLTGASETSPQPNPGPTSNELLVINMLVEFVAAAAATWLFERVLRRIRNLEKESKEWSQMLSRDIRTPLHGLVGLADDLAEQKLIPEDAELRNILMGCMRMLQVVCDNMLGPSTQVERLNAQTIQLATLLDSVTDLARAMASLRSQVVDVTLAPKTSDDTVVRMSVSDFLQIFGNILSNAAKFSPVRSRIAVSLSLEESDDGFVMQMSVEDSGPGIRPELRGKIFRAFERGDAPSAVDGLGIGLSIVEQLAASTGSEVTCLRASEMLGGARFDVRMPCTVVFQQPVSVRNRSVPNCEVGRVIIVDDNALNRRILVRFVGMLGVARADITDVPSGESALQVIKHEQRPYGIALLDMVLPGMNGIELAQRLSDLHTQKFPMDPAIVLVGASASLTPAVSRAWTDVGVIKQLSKPFTKDVVGEAFDFVHSQRCGFHPSNQGLNNRVSSENARRVEFVAPPGPPCPVKTARDGLLSQLGTFDLAIWLKIVASLLYSGTSLRLGSARLLELYSLWTMSYRWMLNKHRSALRFAIVMSVYFVLVVKSSLSGCERVVGYTAFPLFAGFFFTDWSIYVWLAVCGIGQIALSLLKTWDLALVCMPVVNVSRTAALQDAATMTVLIAIFILIDLSLVALAAITRQRWSRTISHDVRGPLHGILAAGRDLELSTSLGVHERQMFREFVASAACLLGVADAVLGFAVERVSMVDTVRLDELQLTLRDLFEMALDPEYVLLDEQPQQRAHILCDEPLMMYALSQFVAAPSLMVLERVRIRISMTLDSTGQGQDSILTISAEEAARPPSLDAQEHEYIDNASVVWGGNANRSALARIVEDFLGGTVFFIRDVPSLTSSDTSVSLDASCRMPWKLSISLPVIVADTSATHTSAARSALVEHALEETENIPRKLGNLHVAVVDDARLNLRVFERLLNNCGVKNIVAFWSSRVAVTALDKGEFDRIDVVFLDLRMPTVDGFQLASDILAHFAARKLKTPVLVASSSDSSVSTAHKCEQAGIGLRLPKPFVGDALRRVLVEAIIIQSEPCQFGQKNDLPVRELSCASSGHQS